MTSIYPYSSPIILTPTIFALYGGKGTGAFTPEQLDICFQQAEHQATAYIGTFLLPTIVTGTYSTVPTYTQRIATDYGYVSRILDVSIKTAKLTYSNGAELLTDRGAAFIYDDTFGYVDVYRLQGLCGCPNTGNYPYQYQITYEAGLPTGTATLPLMLQALTMAAQIHLNEMYPGVVGVNEGTADVGIQEFESFTYRERRTAHALVKNSFGGSATSTRIANLIKSCIKLARKSLKIS
jgi:hypothetical protein